MADGSITPISCDTFVALPPATASGCVVFGKNSDRPDEEIQEVVYQPAVDHESGSKLLVLKYMKNLFKDRMAVTVTIVFQAKLFSLSQRQFFLLGCLQANNDTFCYRTCVILVFPKAFFAFFYLFCGKNTGFYSSGSLTVRPSLNFYTEFGS